MEINTCITKEDWVRFRQSDQRMWPATRYRRLAWAVLPAIAIAGLSLGAVVLFGPRPLSLAMALLPAGLALALHLVLFSLVERRRLGRQFELLAKGSRGQFLSGRILLTLSEDGISACSDSERATWLWTQVRTVVANNDYGYVYFYPGRALIIPRRDCPDAETFQTFMKSAVIFHWNKEKRDVSDASGPDLSQRRRAAQPV